MVFEMMTKWTKPGDRSVLSVNLGYARRSKWRYDEQQHRPSSV